VSHAEFHYAECHYVKCRCDVCSQYAEWHYAKCNYTDCRAVSDTYCQECLMLSFIIPSVIMLSVVVIVSFHRECHAVSHV
jgi:hypothetical protein